MHGKTIDSLSSDLMIACCRFRHPMETANTIKMLLDGGANVNVSNSVQKSPLHEACDHVQGMFIKGEKLIFKYLLDANANVNAIDKNGRIPLRILCGRNIRHQQRYVKLLLREDIDDVGMSTSLSCALKNNNLDIVVMLIRSGAIMDTSKYPVRHFNRSQRRNLHGFSKEPPCECDDFWAIDLHSLVCILCAHSYVRAQQTYEKKLVKLIRDDPIAPHGTKRLVLKLVPIVSLDRNLRLI